MTRRPLALALALAASAPLASAQLCNADIHWQNDILPQFPQGPQAFSLIPGICDGEAIGSVFTLDPGQNVQRIETVSVGFGHQTGGTAGGAEVSVEIYDGVTFVGGNPIMGPKIFDWFSDHGASQTITPTAINEIDLSQYNIEVGGNGNFVVAFRVLNNISAGSCAAGFQANFFTDNSSPPLGSCQPGVTPPQTNLIFVTAAGDPPVGGPGWKDVTTAQFQGPFGIVVDMCPLYVSGNWVIRSCTTDTGAPANPLQVQVVSEPIALPGTAILTFQAPGYEGELYVAASSLGTSPGIPLPDGVLPLNPDAVFSASLANPAVFVNFFGTIGAAGTATGLLSLPSHPSLPGLEVFTAFVTVPAVGPWGISDAGSVHIP